jgi:probable rRNA maturation factor
VPSAAQTPKLSVTTGILGQTRLPALKRGQLRRWVASALRAAEYHGDQATICFMFADQAQAKKLNLAHRKKPYSPNVLSFVYSTNPVHADILICPAVVSQQAVQQGKTDQDHLQHMVVHGVLHALGFDHNTPADATVMEALEVRILRAYGIADPYGIR